MGQVRQEDPVEVSVEHDVGGLQVAVVQVLGRVDVSLVVPGKRLFELTPTFRKRRLTLGLFTLGLFMIGLFTIGLFTLGLFTWRLI